MGQDPAPYIQNALASVVNSIGRLYAYGGRRFLLLNVPDVGKTPAVRMLGQVAVAGAGLLSAQYNTYLEGLRLNLMQALPGSDIRILDIYTLLNNVVANPQTYGIANVTDACITPGQPPFQCKRPDTYVFWDGIHPTKAVHQIVAQQALAAIAAP